MESRGQVPRRWLRQGLVFPPDDLRRPDWMSTHASLPHAVQTGNGSQVRVFYSGRDRQNRASIGAVSVDLRTLRVVPGSLTEEPLLAPGPLGAFDDSGVTISCVVSHRDRLYLYYTGWALGQTVPFYLAVGVAVSVDGGNSFERLSAAPILDRHPVDPYLSASPSVLVERESWRMWYVSGRRWEARPEGPRHYYLIRSAESADGINWTRHDEVAVDFVGADEFAMGRPHVLRLDGNYHMWFCSRGERYRLRYACSSDGRHWQRHDDAVGLDPAPQGWDGEMQAYPCVLHAAGRWWMFYNGNDYGAAGFGIAEGVSKEPKVPLS